MTQLLRWETQFSFITSMIKISDKNTNILVILLLALMFFLAVFSVKDDTVTTDEMLRIVSGYTYLTYKDFRLHFEDPPLATDLMAFPLLFLNLNFPEEHTSWTEAVNGQGSLGPAFFNESGNDPEKFLFWARLPMIFVLIFLGWFLFYWARELRGNEVGLLVLILFSFSPTFLAHGRLATNDVAAALAVVLATYFYLKFLKNPDKKNILFSGLSFGLALLIKFSMLLLIPFFGIITLIFWWSESYAKKRILKYFKFAVLIGLIAVLLVWVFYQFHLLNYPPERQLRDTRASLVYEGIDSMEELCILMAEIPILRPLAHYLLGFLVTFEREFFYGHEVPAGATYFLGMSSNQGFWYYFPIAYLIKVPLALHLLTLSAFLSAFYFLEETSFRRWLKKHFVEFSMLIFILIYSLSAIRGRVNIGIRHILPIFPFTYILISAGINDWIKRIRTERLKKVTITLVLLLLSWYGFSSLSVFPHYLCYFNELVGGSENGYEYLVDSNCDWGQDLKRLAQWVDLQGIEKIYLDYSGGANMKYYLGEKLIPWWGACWWLQWNVHQDIQDFPKGNYLAVSATHLQGGRGKPKDGSNVYWGCFNWLNDYRPVAQIGNSILIYYIDD